MTSTGHHPAAATPAWIQRIPPMFRPPFETARHYTLQKFRKDVLAGLTVSVVEIPQAMAYALIAGVPPQYGIYTSIIQGIVGALLSSSEHMTTGPTNTQSLLIASAVHRIVSPDADPQLYLNLVFSLALLKGLLQLGFAAARMGTLVRYISRPVISGLVSGAGLLIFFGQLPAMFGIVSRAPSEPPGIFAPITRIASHLDEFNPRALMLGLAVIAIVAGVRRISKLLPGALAAIVLAASFVYAAGWTNGEVSLIGILPRGMPTFHVPWVSWQHFESLFGGALALAIIGMLESVSIAKSIAAKTGDEVDANQEFFAQGLKNFASSFFQCIPGSGSFTRSALDYAAGAQTRFAAVFNGCFVAGIFFLLAEPAQFIPIASLSGVLTVIAFGLVDWGYLPRVFRASGKDAAVWGITFMATLLAPLEYAIFIGVVLNLGLYLRTASRLHLNEVVPDDSTQLFSERALSDRRGGQPVVLLQVEGDLFFGVADELADRLNTLVHQGTRVVILRLRYTHSVDSTVMHVIEKLARDLRERGGHVILCGVSPDLMRVLRQFGLVQTLGEENVFELTPGFYGGVRKAFARAEVLLGHSIDCGDDKANLDDEPLMYVI